MTAPVLEARSAEQLAAALRARIPAFVPEWQAAPGGPGSGLLAIYGHFLRALAQRIDAAPDKNELAFLDLLGLDVLPAGAARAPVVFSTLPGGGNGRAPARTRLGAKGPDPARPVVFETERPVALADARLADVYTLWPGRDAYADHSAAATGGRAFTLWDGLEPVAHELYLAHDLHFALTGRASVALQVELAPGGSAPLELDWSWWDGSGWRSFKRFAPTDRIGESRDGTAGLTRSGTIRLETDCAASVQRSVGGWAGHWLRASVADPLPPAASRTLPQLDRVVVRTVVSQALNATCTAGLRPDSAFADGQQLDLTKPAQPLGANPGSGSAFYLTCAEAFSRPQATVTICVRKALTPADEADAKSHQYELDVTKAKQLLDAARKAAKLTKDALDALAAAELDTSNLPDLWAPNQPDQWYADMRSTVTMVRTTVLHALPFAVEALRLSTAQMVPGFGLIAGLIGLHDPRDSLIDLIKVANLLSATPGSYAFESTTLQTKATSLVSQATGFPPVPDVSSWADLPGAATAFVTKVNADSIFLPAALPAIFTDAQTHFDDLKARLKNARLALQDARTQAQIVIDKLALLSPMSAAAASGFLPPTLDPPKLAWEYWNGSDWSSLGVTPSQADVGELRADGELTFSVPDNWASRRSTAWTACGRAPACSRAATPSCGSSAGSIRRPQAVNFLPIIEPRPPVLSALRIGYTWASQPAAPQRA